MVGFPKPHSREMAIQEGSLLRMECKGYRRDREKTWMCLTLKMWARNLFISDFYL